MQDVLKAILKQKGYSLTAPRKAVFSVLLGNQPQSMQEIVKKLDGKVDRASVYRTTELFEKLGVIQRLNIGFKYKLELTEAFIGHHHHFYCTNCGKTYSMEANTMLETMIETIAAKSGYKPRGHQLEIYGFCKDCFTPAS